MVCIMLGNRLDNPRFAKAFARDAQNAITSLREALENDDIKKLTSTFHAIKSGLANMGLEEQSSRALELERAGLNGNLAFIKERVGDFIQMLESYIPKEENAETAAATATPPPAASLKVEDTAFVRQQLAIIKDSCAEYDIMAADTEIGALLEKPLRRETAEFLEQMRDILYSDSDFDGVCERIEEFISKDNKGV